MLSIWITCTEKPNVKFLLTTRVRCLKNDDAINPFPSKKLILPKDTLWCKSSNFLLTNWLSRAKTYHKDVYKSNTSRLSDPNENIRLQSSGMRRKHNFEIVFGFKSDTAVWTFHFALANPPPPPSFAFLVSFFVIPLMGIKEASFGKKTILGKLLWSSDYMKGNIVL